MCVGRSLLMGGSIPPSISQKISNFYKINNKSYFIGRFSTIDSGNLFSIRQFSNVNKVPPLFGHTPKNTLAKKIGVLLFGSGGLYIAYKIINECMCENPPKNCTGDICNLSESRRILAGNVDDFTRGGIYEIKTGDPGEKVLLHNVKGKFYSTSANCPHFPSELIQGISTDEVLVCPWHNAKFKITTGECIGGPIIDNLPTYPVEIVDNKIYILMPKIVASQTKCMGKKSKSSIGGGSTYVIIGGGAAAHSAAETLRNEGFCGVIKMYSSDGFQPYYRPALSKVIKLDEPDNLHKEHRLRDPEFYKDQKIEFYPNTNVKKVDTLKKKILLDNGTVVNFDKVLIATGVESAKLRIESRDSANNIFTLRQLNDLYNIAKYAKRGKRIVIVGANFIGSEAASSLLTSGAHVTVITDTEYPMENVFGRRVGSAILSLYDQNNVKFISKSLVTKYHVKGGLCNAVELNNGQKIAADCVIEGVGSIPKRPNIDGVDRGFIRVDSMQRVGGNPDVYAAGDIVEFPYFLTGDYINIQHWNVAVQQGTIAAKNMLGKITTQTQIPFFWSSMFRKNLRYSGYVKKYDDVIIEGDLKSLNFIAYYTIGNKVMATLAVGNDKFGAASGEAIKYGLMPTKSELVLGAKNSKNVIETLEVVLDDLEEENVTLRLNYINFIYN